ncbi:primosomal protein N' [Limosilactobacillus coleohominis 101-4-CHN]|uniref:Replication restart protein PriA n=1 Tax=Limosilactobacillus coleohominis 101-4-CHN TaxID=575594 RepID=C7XUQ2_9LACO|nr:primosomal protein N' [Limosilactobacillus coleohominis 101-4-CHN]
MAVAELAQVIVDVPTLQTNRPYTYQVPPKLEHQIQVGMRVIVPFGKGKRSVQGFVVGLDQPADFQGTLKQITALMDLVPVVNSEMMQLSHWLADKTYSFWISCLYTMLPNMLKAKSKRIVKLVQPLAPEDQAIFGQQNVLDYSLVQNQASIVSRLLTLKRAGKVQFEYQVQDRARVKTVAQIQPVLTVDEYKQLRSKTRANATAQRKMLDYLQSIVGQQVLISQAQKTTHLSSANFRQAEDKGWISMQQIEQYRQPFGAELTDPAAKDPLYLNLDQQRALASVKQSIDNRQSTVFLLQGVTGSGKTEVYLQAMAHALQQGKTALLMVPEISLTPQIAERVRARFSSQVAVLHSGLSAGERYDEWRRIERGEAQVVVGARSAVFAPLKNIGIIIMDEEHETSYKQDDAPRYHSREVAKWRAKYHHAPLLLGSATPSLESYSRALAGNYQLLQLPHRVNKRPLPPIKIVDMRPEVQRRGESNFSTALLTALQERLTKHEQSILMLNRRGFSSFIMCRDCGFVLKCPNCDISLTMHLDTHTMRCHYCGHEEPIPQRCPQCHGRHIRYYGTGTEKATKELQALLPTARILRMDVDTTRRKGMHEKLLQKFGSGQADILLGTQMIAKGLDFPNVTLVGVLNADTGLDLPDFRASERSFDLLSQVSGRAGRADKKGQVIVQTFNPDNYVIRLVQAHDYRKFFNTEMQIRQLASYPPYYYTIRLMGSHEDEQVAAKMMYDIRQELGKQLASDTMILGPTPRAIARLKKRYYYQIVIKYRQDPQLHSLLTKIMQEAQNKYQRGAELAIDPDPQYFL